MPEGVVFDSRGGTGKGRSERPVARKASLITGAENAGPHIGELEG